jgi:hypothetical protein
MATKDDTTTGDGPNTLNPTPPELNPARFLGMSTKDGEIVPPVTADGPKPSKEATKDTNGKRPATSAPKVSAKVNVGEEESDEDDEEKQPSKPSSRVQKRIDQATARQRAAERRADLAEANLLQLERRLAAMEAEMRSLRTGGVDTAGKSTTSDPNAPQPSSYEYGELDARYIRDLAKYEARKELEAERAKTQSEAARQSAEAAARERATKIDAWAQAEGAKKYDDFDEVVIQGAKDGLWPLSATLGQLILESEFGHDIAYSLASNPKEAARIARMAPEKQAAWFGKEEARLAAGAASPGETHDDIQQKPKVTQAPIPPVHRAKGSGESNPVSPDTTDFAAFERLAMQNK